MRIIESWETAQEVEVRLRDEIIDVAGHDDCDTELIVERHRGAGDHRARLAALNAAVHQTGDRLRWRPRRIDVTCLSFGVGFDDRTHDHFGVASRVRLLPIVLQLQRFQRFFEVRPVRDHGSRLVQRGFGLGSPIRGFSARITLWPPFGGSRRG